MHSMILQSNCEFQEKELHLSDQYISMATHDFWIYDT